MSTPRLLPLREAVASVVARELNPSTIWRWCHRGFPGEDGCRIRLPVQYVGRLPCCTPEDVRDFLAKITQARLARSLRTQHLAADVTDEELAAVGLTSSGGPRK